MRFDCFGGTVSSREVGKRTGIILLGNDLPQLLFARGDHGGRNEIKVAPKVSTRCRGAVHSICTWCGPQIPLGVDPLFDSLDCAGHRRV